MREYALVLLVAAAVTFLLVPLVRRVAVATGAMAEPRARDLHTEPTPRLGGLAMYGGLVAGLLVASRLPFVQAPFQTAGSRAQNGLLLAGGLLVLVGFIDDRWGMSAISKLAGQVAAAGILVWSGESLPWLPMPNGHIFSLEPDLSATLTILLVVITINAVNFIDGMDGLAAGIVAVAALSFLAYSYWLVSHLGNPDQSLPAVSSALLAGMCIGFLPHNFYPARIFMGDTGSMLLGLMLAYGPISSTATLDPAVLIDYRSTHVADRFATLVPLLVPAAIFLIPYTDLVMAVVRRMTRGTPLMGADKEHLHHRLLNIGHSYRQSVLIMWLWAAFFCTLVVVLSVSQTQLAVLAVVTAFAVLTLLPLTMPGLRPWRLLTHARSGQTAPPRPKSEPIPAGTAPAGSLATGSLAAGAGRTGSTPDGGSRARLTPGGTTPNGPGPGDPRHGGPASGDPRQAGSVPGDPRQGGPVSGDPRQAGSAPATHRRAPTAPRPSAAPRPAAPARPTGGSPRPAVPGRTTGPRPAPPPTPAASRSAAPPRSGYAPLANFHPPVIGNGTSQGSNGSTTSNGSAGANGIGAQGASGNGMRGASRDEVRGVSGDGVRGASGPSGPNHTIGPNGNAADASNGAEGAGRGRPVPGPGPGEHLLRPFPADADLGLDPTEQS